MASTRLEYDFPFAAAPDIIRAVEKDKFFHGVLQERLSNVLRRLYGSRFVQTHTGEARVFAELLYLGCTTLLGYRTLGEEYCETVQIDHRRLGVPSLCRRLSYILSTFLLPYSLAKVAPQLRAFVQRKLSSTRDSKKPNASSPRSFLDLLELYLPTNPEASMSPSLLYSLSLAAFYFTGAYYHLSTRFLGLRYVSTRNSNQQSEDTSYEVLGVLLLLQMVAYGWNHLKTTMRLVSAHRTPATANQHSASADAEDGPPEHSSAGQSQRSPLETIMLTSFQRPRCTLADPMSLKWIQGKQQRKCTLCLEESKDPSVTTCGHVFCWNCINEWIAEKPECPLCRQSIQAQHVLPLRQGQL